MHYCATCNRLTDWTARCDVCRDKRIAELEAELSEVRGNLASHIDYTDKLGIKVKELEAALREIAAKPQEILAILEQNNLVVTGKLELTIYTELVVAAEIAKRALEGK